MPCTGARVKEGSLADGAGLPSSGRAARPRAGALDGGAGCLDTVALEIAPIPEEEVTMPLVVDIERARILAERLHRLFAVTGEGIHGQKEMPEDAPPKGVERGSLDHLLFITLTVAIDYQRDAHTLWNAARQTFEDPEVCYLFDPAAVHAAGNAKVVADMQRHRLSKKPGKDARIWQQVAISFLKKWGGDPRNFLADCGMSGPVVLARLAADVHKERGRNVADYPYLRGPKIGPLWLRMLRDNVGIDLSDLDAVPIPVDVHVARASFTTGVVRGSYSGAVSEAFEEIRNVWRAATALVPHPAGRPMMALDVDEPLWHLSKFGCLPGRDQAGSCTKKAACPVAYECVTGRVQVGAGGIEVQT